MGAPDRLTPPRLGLLGITVVAGWLFLGIGSASALSQGTISGTVSDAHGPVADAVVFFVGEEHNLAHTTTDAGGNYSLPAWPDVYAVGVTPPIGSSDGYMAEDGIFVTEGATTTKNVALPASEGTATLSGNASYPDHAPAGGIEVTASPENFRPETYRFTPHYTDESGNWDAGTLPAGTYVVDVGVYGNASGFPPSPTVGSFQFVLLGPGSNHVLNTTLVGPKPAGMLTATVTTPEGHPSAGTEFKMTPVGGGDGEVLYGDEDGRFRAWAPSGTYVLSGGEEIYGEGTATVSMSDGRLGGVAIQLQRHSMQVPAGTAAQHEERDLAWLNHQRERWGLPGGIVAVPQWSQACAAHDNYMAINRVLQHPEDDKSGHSPGGAWAGEHSILAASGGWALESNPWMDAPVHLNQLLTPSLNVIGLDERDDGYGCATTWPGLTGRPAPLGTVFTFPGDGTTGLPPSELAAEVPQTPNEALGIDNLAGRQLFVYEEGFDGSHDRYGRLHVLAASLSSTSGPVAIKWLDQETSLGGFLTGAIIVPLHPLEPYTSYTASVTLAEGGHGQIPQVAHTWSFTTGPPNPDGYWPRGAPAPRRSTKLPRPPLKLKVRQTNPHAWKIQIKAGRVLLGYRAKLTVSRERPVCRKKTRPASGRRGCNWDWLGIGKKRRGAITLRRHSSLRLRLEDWQRASIGIRTRPFSVGGKRYGSASASVRIFGPKPSRAG